MLTVEWLLGQTSLGLTLVAGATGLAREVSWAHAIELDDPSPWLSGGEVILTTGLHRTANATSWAQYIDTLDAAGASALGFGVGVVHPTIPSELLESADRLGFPVLAVPLPTPFIAVARAVVDRLSEERTAEIRRTVDYQSKMNRIAAEQGVIGIVKHLSRLVDGDVVVTDANLVVQAAEPPNASGLHARVTTEMDGRVHQGRLGISVSDAAGQLTVQSISAGAGYRGCVAVATLLPLRPMQHLLLNQAVSLISLEWERPRNVRAREAGMRATLLQLALSRTLDDQELAWHTDLFGFRNGDRLTAINVTSSLPAPQLRVLTEETMLASGRPFLLNTDTSDILVISTERGWQRSATDLLAAVKSAKLNPICIGVGIPVAWTELWRSAQQARYAARIGQSERRELTVFEDLGVFGLLLSNLDPDMLKALADRVLEPLEAYDRQGGELVTSLTAFLDENGHWESAAAKLGLHRHSLRYRIKKIQQLSGRSLDSAKDRTEFAVALAARALGSDEFDQHQRAG